MQKKRDEYCGFIAIIGASNAGKSTLLNKIVGTKVSIVSSKFTLTANYFLNPESFSPNLQLN